MEIRVYSWRNPAAHMCLCVVSHQAAALGLSCCTQATLCGMV